MTLEDLQKYGPQSVYALIYEVPAADRDRGEWRIGRAAWEKISEHPWWGPHVNAWAPIPPYYFLGFPIRFEDGDHVRFEVQPRTEPAALLLSGYSDPERDLIKAAFDCRHERPALWQSVCAEFNIKSMHRQLCAGDYFEDGLEDDAS